MNALAWAGAAVGIAMFAPLWKQIRAGTAHQNLLTWVLFSALDLVVGLSILVQHGSWFLPLAYSLGSAITAGFIAKSGEPMKWTWFETFVLSMTVVCMIVWKVSGSAMATIAATVAVTIAGLPLFRDAWRDPETAPAVIYFGYLVANGLATAGGKGWTIEERFYPAVCTVFAALLTFVAGREYLPFYEVATRVDVDIDD